MSKLIVLLPFIVVYAIVFVLTCVLKKRKIPNTASNHYDERQLLIQGRAYKYAFFTLLTYILVIGTLTAILERDFATTYVYSLIGLCLALIVYVTYSLFEDAYIGRDGSKNISAGLAFLVGICNAVPALLNLDKIYVNGILQATSGQLVMGLTFIYVGIILIVKRRMDKQEI